MKIKNLTIFALIGILAATLIQSVIFAMDARTPQQFRSDQVSSENEHFIRKIQQEMGMKDWHIVIKRESHNGEWRKSMAAGGSLISEDCFIIMDEDWFNTLSENEKRFSIGHELSHIKKHHDKKKILYHLGLLFSTIVAKKKYQFSWLTLSTIFGIGFFVGTPWYQRQMEREADLNAARELNAYEGGIAWYERRIRDGAGKKRPEQGLFAFHPSYEEGKAYLQKAYLKSLADSTC